MNKFRSKGGIYIILPIILLLCLININSYSKQQQQPSSPIQKDVYLNAPSPKEKKDNPHVILSKTI